MAMAYEVLVKNCDILRVIGCSLSQNDWNIISLLFNAQYKQYCYKKTCFKIELIMGPESCDRIIKEYSYLKNVFAIGYLTDGKFADYKDKNKITKGSELENFFKYWLKSKVLFHKSKNEFDYKGIGKALKEVIK
jgi:hypothetical protein